MLRPVPARPNDTRNDCMAFAPRHQRARQHPAFKAINQITQYKGAGLDRTEPFFKIVAKLEKRVAGRA